MIIRKIRMLCVLVLFMGVLSIGVARYSYTQGSSDAITDIVKQIENGSITLIESKTLEEACVALSI